MPNIASVFKAEITRLARKELRENNDGLKKAVATQRSEIAALKRRVQALEALVKRLARTEVARPARGRVAATGEADAPEAGELRFRAAGMAANRKRLGLSAADFA